MRMPGGPLLLLLLAPAPAMAASAPPVPPATAATPQPPARNPLLEELDEVLVEGERSRPPTNWDAYQQHFEFLARLVGEFTVEGSVDLRTLGSADGLRQVSGSALCLGFGSAPGVQCELKVQWPEVRGPGGEVIPGGISALNPAVLLFGYENQVRGISHVLVDSNGVANAATARMTSANSIYSRAQCEDIAGDCVRTVRITAEPDLVPIRMDIDLSIDGQEAVSFAFVLKRVAGSVSVVHGRKQTKDKRK